MHVRKILIYPSFTKEFRKLDPALQERTMKAHALFRGNPLHPSLRLHLLKGKLQGLGSVSVTMGVRIIFQRMENGDIVFLSVGKHDLYRSW